MKRNNLSSSHQATFVMIAFTIAASQSNLDCLDEGECIRDESFYFSSSTCSEPLNDKTRKADTREEFSNLCEQWRKDTRRSSVAAVRYSHPAYQQILTMGESAVPWILTELKLRPDRWFSALKFITKEDPTSPNDTFDSAVQSWLQWGRSHGYDV